MGDFFEEIWEELSDFFEDYKEHLLGRPHARPQEQGSAVVGGSLTAVRPAYLFAERIDNLLKVLFGISICLSAVTATFLGFTKLSDLLDVLISTLWGRGIMFVIGGSYVTIAVWKILHMGRLKKTSEKIFN